MRVIDFLYRLAGTLLFVSLVLATAYYFHTPDSLLGDLPLGDLLRILSGELTVLVLISGVIAALLSGPVGRYLKKTSSWLLALLAVVMLVLAVLFSVTLFESGGWAWMIPLGLCAGALFAALPRIRLQRQLAGA